MLQSIPCVLSAEWGTASTYQGHVWLQCSASKDLLMQRNVLLALQNSHLLVQVLPNTSIRSARCWLVSTVSTFLALCMLNTSTHSARCLVVIGGYLNTLTFVVPVLVSFYPFCRSNFLLLMLHLPELLSISNFFSSLSIRFLSCCFLYFCYWSLSVYHYPTFPDDTCAFTAFAAMTKILRPNLWKWEPFLSNVAIRPIY